MAKRRRCKLTHPHDPHEWRPNTTPVGKGLSKPPRNLFCAVEPVNYWCRGV